MVGMHGLLVRQRSEIFRPDLMFGGIEEHRRNDQSALDHLGVVGLQHQKVDRSPDRTQEQHAGHHARQLAFAALYVVVR
jgi:hypothetical protein